ncbi:MAG: AAA family ATPase [Gammaproteobacteria bacterium]|nr:MAG: AAA family ATPase [Gammaproteobacteria bacterium]PIE37135.1 MAG: AAA family ATPase [Gammaproteobacteria bacterium]
MSHREQFVALARTLERRLIGQELMVNRLLLALLANGHLLVEGAPGLAKTRAIRSLADCLDLDYQRIQFTPDLLPADLTGTEVYRPADGSFVFQRGPLFNHLVLADEINRAPAKVQSALLEAMSESQISVAHQSYHLPTPFLVMATQNPIEQEGTYPLPEAQLDRFFMKVLVDYPDPALEQHILTLVREENRREQQQREARRSTDAVARSPAVRIGPGDIHAARCEVLDLHMAEPVEAYLVSLVTATRDPGQLDTRLGKWLQFGASPRGTIALDAASRAHAWLVGRDYVSPGDVQAVVHDVLRHRLLLSFEAEAEGISGDDIVNELLNLVVVP